MTKLTEIADVQRQQELAKSDFNSNKTYNGSKLVHDDIGSAIDIGERTTEIARNDFNSQKTYNSSSVN